MFADEDNHGNSSNFPSRDNVDFLDQFITLDQYLGNKENDGMFDDVNENIKYENDLYSFDDEVNQYSDPACNSLGYEKLTSSSKDEELIKEEINDDYQDDDFELFTNPSIKEFETCANPTEKVESMQSDCDEYEESINSGLTSMG